MTGRELPSKVRVSIGSAIAIGLTQGLLDAKPTTVYLLTYHEGKCQANCGFCPQARKSEGRADMLSRVTWPPFSTSEVFSKLRVASKKGMIKRVCIQALNYPRSHDDVESLVEEIGKQIGIPISVCSQPMEFKRMKALKSVGVERIGIPLDGATEEIFKRVKGSLAHGPYMWDRQREILKKALGVFGKGKVTTHMIVGLGESAKEMIHTIQWCVDNGIYPSLFSFTPIRGTDLEKYKQPLLSHYRKIQTARHLIVTKKARFENMKFNEDGQLVDFGVSDDQLKNVVMSGIPFITSGCPDCNRPYYNESPSGPIYNFPRPPLSEEIVQIEKELKTKKKAIMRSRARQQGVL